MSNKGLHFYLQGRNSAYTRFYLIYSPDDTFQQFEYKEHDKYLLKNGRDCFYFHACTVHFTPDHVLQIDKYNSSHILEYKYISSF